MANDDDVSSVRSTFGPGGAWRYGIRDTNGQEFVFSGEYREVVPPARLVSTEGWEAMPGHEYLVTVTFEEEDGKTKMTSHLLYQNGADRDGHLQSGMEAGMQESYVRLDEHLATMQYRSRANFPINDAAAAARGSICLVTAASFVRQIPAVGRGRLVRLTSTQGRRLAWPRSRSWSARES